MTKKLIMGVGVFLLSISTVLTSADAATGGGRRGNPPSVPEPVSCILVLAGGATLAVVRRLRNRRNSNHQDTDNSAS